MKKRRRNKLLKIKAYVYQEDVEYSPGYFLHHQLTAHTALSAPLTVLQKTATNKSKNCLVTKQAITKSNKIIIVVIMLKIITLKIKTANFQKFNKYSLHFKKGNTLQNYPS